MTYSDHDVNSPPTAEWAAEKQGRELVPWTSSPDTIHGAVGRTVWLPADTPVVLLDRSCPLASHDTQKTLQVQNRGWGGEREGGTGREGKRREKFIVPAHPSCLFAILCKRTQLTGKRTRNWTRPTRAEKDETEKKDEEEGTVQRDDHLAVLLTAVTSCLIVT